MSTRIVLLALLTALAGGCKSVECGPGTAESDGACTPSNVTVATARCGPFTELHGDTCVPMFPPTTCDPDTTQPDTDMATGVTTCIGTGAAGCAAKLACPTPGDATQTICGQIYDFETGQPFADPAATGGKCDAPTATGPCSVGIRAFDAVAFAMNPTMTPPLATGAVYIDTCGRYRVPGIATPSGPFIALAIDDIAPASAGAAGTTNPTGVAAAKASGQATKDLEAYVVKGAVAAGWGSPSLASGIFAAVYHGHRMGTDLAAGVTFTFGPMTSPPPTMTNVDRDFYFAAGATTRTTLDPGVSATGANGTALASGVNLGELYAGRGALPATCMWEIHAGAAVPGVVFVQSFRPTDVPGMTCPL